MKTVRDSLFIVLLVAFTLNAQKEQSKAGTDIIGNAVAKLQQKVLLSETQASEIKTLLNRNINNLQSNQVGDLKSKVEGMLDAKQKAKYSIIKDDWWNNLVRDSGQSTK
jgi:phenylalanyl-tRNA synthetase beta subunit